MELGPVPLVALAGVVGIGERELGVVVGRGGIKMAAAS